MPWMTPPDCTTEPAGGSSPACYGRLNVPRRVIGCHSTQETRVRNAFCRGSMT
jgi:hypothetical protein